MPFRSLREFVHCGGALPAEVSFELVLVPTFHQPLGVRAKRDSIELWFPGDAQEVPTRLGAELAGLTSSLSSLPPELPGEGRDGLVVLFRTHQVELVRLTVTAPDDDPVFDFARTVLTRLSAPPLSPALILPVSALRSYF